MTDPRWRWGRFLSDREGERTTLRDLEEYLGVSHPTVVGLARRLTEKGGEALVSTTVTNLQKNK